ncbi:MAG: TatD family hydrolase [Ignavibacteriales bacterium]|nr:TatD family hydrolase [Ignavibacteriales bacterium]
MVAAERVPKSRKLLKLEVDLGTERRTLVAGIAEALRAGGAGRPRHRRWSRTSKPATVMGVESNGMILAASAPGGLPIVRELRQGTAARRAHQVGPVRHLRAQPVPPRERVSNRRHAWSTPTPISPTSLRADVDAVVQRPAPSRSPAILCIVDASDPEEAARARRVLHALGRHPHDLRRPPAPRRARLRTRPARRRRAGRRPHRRRAAREGGRRGRPRLSLRLRAAGRAARACSPSRSGWPATAGLPLVIHTREADDDTIDDAEAGRGGARLAGCSTASPATSSLARRALDLGFYVSFSGIVTFPKAGAGPRARRPSCRSTASSSRPTRRTWRRCRIGARGTNRAGSWTSSRRSRGLRGIGAGSPGGRRRRPTTRHCSPRDAPIAAEPLVRTQVGALTPVGECGLMAHCVLLLWKTRRPPFRRSSNPSVTTSPGSTRSSSATSSRRSS